MDMTRVSYRMMICSNAAESPPSVKRTSREISAASGRQSLVREARHRQRLLGEQ